MGTGRGSLGRAKFWLFWGGGGGEGWSLSGSGGWNLAASGGGGFTTTPPPPLNGKFYVEGTKKRYKNVIFLNIYCILHFLKKLYFLQEKKDKICELYATFGGVLGGKVIKILRMSSLTKGAINGTFWGGWVFQCSGGVNPPILPPPNAHVWTQHFFSQICTFLCTDMWVDILCYNETPTFLVWPSRPNLAAGRRLSWAGRAAVDFKLSWESSCGFTYMHSYIFNMLI